MSEDLGNNEEFLLAQVAKGDNGAFSFLYKKYVNDLYGFIVSITHSPADAKDMVHDTFLAIFTKRQDLAGIRNFRTYLFAAAKNRAFNLLKKNSRILLTGDAEELSTGARHITEETFDGKNFNEFLEKEKKNLPDQQRIAFSLSRDDGLTIAQIAEIMKLSQSTVREHISKALKMLRKKYLDYRNPLLILLFALIFPF